MFKRFLLLTAASLVLLSLPALGQVRQVTIDSETMTVRDLLKEVERQSGLSFAYDNADVDLSAEVKAKAHKEDVLSFLNRVLASRNLEAQLEQIYLNAVSLQESGFYKDAAAVYASLEGYRDSGERSSECLYSLA